MTRFKLVPVEPTRKMIKAGAEAYSFDERNIYRAMLAAAPSPWVSVEDLLPADETDVLVRGECHGQDIFTVAGRFYGDWMSQETEEVISFEPTHWMPLPPPPAKQESIE